MFKRISNFLAQSGERNKQLKELRSGSIKLCMVFNKSESAFANKVQGELNTIKNLGYMVLDISYTHTWEKGFCCFITYDTENDLENEELENDEEISEKN